MQRELSFLALAVAALTASVALACPYCTVESNTLTEEMEASDAVVLATLVLPEGASAEGDGDAPDASAVVDPDTGQAKFRVERVLLGKELMQGIEEIEAVFFGEPVEGQLYFIRGVGTTTLDWNIPMPLSDTAVKYVEEIQKLPPTGPERMEYFLNYLQHDDPLLAQDSYDEFARAPYADVIAIKDKMDRPQLWRWIEDRDVSPSRRSLFFTMLGVCGEQEDADRLHQMMLADVRVLRSAAEASMAAGLGLGGAITLPIVPEMVSMDQRRKQLGFNAMVGCYLKLTGADGLDVVDESFLEDPHADPTKVYGVLIALRFLGEETDDVSHGRLLESMRLVLEKPDFAEQAITDLARWEDWSVMDRLVTMFKEAEPRTYVKEPIVAYLDQASRQPGDVGERATTALAEIEELDPDTVKRARSLMSFGFLARARTDSNTPGVETADSPALDSTVSGSAISDSAVAVSDDAESATSESAADALDVTTADEPLDTTGEEISAGDSPAVAPASGQPPVAAAVAESDASTAADQLEGVAGETPAASATATSAAPTTGTSSVADKPAPNRLLVLGMPLVVAAGLAGVVWIVLRGGL